LKDYNKEQDDYIIQMILDSKLSIKEIANNLNLSEIAVNHRLKALGLDWVCKTTKQPSRGQTSLTNILKKVIPGEKIVNEFHIGESLRLDIYCPNYKLGIEYHGRQHFEHISFFHEFFEDFLRAQARDDRKIQLCKELGITIVIFRYTDSLTEDTVHDRIISAIRLASSDIPVARKIAKTKLSTRDNPLYQEAKAKRSAFERDLRKKVKQEKKDDKIRTKKIKTEHSLHECEDDLWETDL